MTVLGFHIDFDTIIEMFFAIMIIGGALFHSLSIMFKRLRCKHQRWTTPEYGQHSFHDVCYECGKNLGHQDSPKRVQARKEKENE